MKEAEKVEKAHERLKREQARGLVVSLAVLRYMYVFAVYVLLKAIFDVYTLMLWEVRYSRVVVSRMWFASGTLDYLAQLCFALENCKPLSNASVAMSGRYGGEWLGIWTSPTSVASSIASSRNG